MNLLGLFNKWKRNFNIYIHINRAPVYDPGELEEIEREKKRKQHLDRLYGKKQ